MLTPTRRSHQEHVDPLNTHQDLPTFSIAKSPGEEGKLMSPTDTIRQLEKSKILQAGFIGVSEGVAYLLRKVF